MSSFVQVQATASTSQGHTASHDKSNRNIGRSPCPGLNALANQGYISRDGRNIDPTQLADAMIKVMNLSIDAFDSEIAITLEHTTTGNSSTFNLEDSDVHNCIEIDGSLSRNDLYFGENIYFNQTIWDQSSSKFDGDTITILSAAESQAYRVAVDSATVSNTHLCSYISPGVLSSSLSSLARVPRAWTLLKMFVCIPAALETPI